MTALAPAPRSARGRGLYTPEILALAVELARFGWDEALPRCGSAHSRSCGSRIELALETDAAGRVERVGLRPQACAIGQAAAALFAQSVQGRDRAGIAAARDGIAHWLGEDAALPDWPGLAVLEPARAYPGRHAAILLAWDAALAALD